MKDAKVTPVPEFREMGKLLDDWSETRFEHKQNTDRILKVAVQLGLEKEFTTDARIAFAYLRGIMFAMKTFRGQLMP